MAIPQNNTAQGAIASALVKVRKGVTKLPKSERNNFAKYDFTSVDAFYEAIGPLLCDAEITVLSDCIESEVVDGRVKVDNNGKEKQGAAQLKERWAFTFLHSSGEMLGPYHRSVTVPAEGAQAHGSSESYATKQFLRGVFKVPTGDADDPDAQEAQPHAPARKSAPKPAPKPVIEPRAIPYIPDEGNVTNEHLKEFAEKFKNAFTTAQDKEQLQQWFDLNAKPLNLLKHASETAYPHIMSVREKMEGKLK